MSSTLFEGVVDDFYDVEKYINSWSTEIRPKEIVELN